ncbi:phosphatase PAP2 family protein [Romboutsia sp. 1001713B170207_170306_H8]|uniref:phosphatase PAP2 family protein n=1 Tax=Romboutsia sp. 1001713B170207_170306_H8 TaxID=2787112 RepID=UPI001898BAFE|nr:phosphatase PAP2 family protein [Romboutsia sp. 1001713B170207_170306_H8]
MGIQLEILMYLQSIRSPLLNALFLILTISTEVPIIVLFSALMYWCINKKFGQRILFSLIGNFVVNTGIKEYVRAPRPIGTDGLESLRVSTATGYSFPSGHTQTATSFWTSFMILAKNNWMYILGIIMILAVGISRLYLAVHWPIDVAFGWIFGIFFSIVLIKIFDYVDENKKYWILLLLLVMLSVVGYFLNSESYIEYFGILTGFVLGYIVEDIFINFSTDRKSKGYINFSKNRKNESSLIINIKKFLVGIISLGIVYIILKYTVGIIPNYFDVSNIDSFDMVTNYIRYSIVVFYAVAGVPALFKVLNLDN